ncbi:MAG: Short C-terminal protein [Conexibacter sp.]|jgi:hypothetical protein|nr:Short C-terminal protein [Conexibacter sp.]
MKTVRIALGGAISLAAVTVFCTGLHHLVRAGTCASGGPYVSARPCAPGTGTWAFVLPIAVVAGLAGCWLAYSSHMRVFVWFATLGGFGATALVALRDGTATSGRPAVLGVGVALVVVAVSPLVLLALLRRDRPPPPLTPRRAFGGDDGPA